MSMGEIGNAATAFSSLASAVLLGVLAFGKGPRNWLLEYYPNPTRTGEPTRAWVRHAELGANDTLLDGVPDREDFSLRLETCLAVNHPMDLRVALKASSHGQLYLDGKLVFDNGARPPRNEQKKRRRRHGNSVPKDEEHIALEPGVHSLELDYVNTEGAASFNLAVSEKGFDASLLDSDLRRPALDGTCAAL
jgi:hypothetical protein